MSAGLRICLLGGFRAELAGQAVSTKAWQRTSAKAVVKILALAPGHRLLREQLVEDLWPDQDSAQAAVNLRKALHFARQALSPECLTTDGAMLELSGFPLTVDVEVFEGLARTGKLEEALGVYEGDLLPEDLFEPWTEPRREQLALRLTRVLFDWADDLRNAGRYRESAAALEELIARDPLNEEAHIRLMTVCVASGHDGLALHWYRRLETTLRQELGVTPSAAARGLRERISAGPLPSSAPDVSTTINAETPVGSGLERKLSTSVFVEVQGLDRDADRARDIVQTWGGTLIGRDQLSVLAVFGAPHALEDHAARALRATLDITATLGRGVRCGVATSEVTIDPETPPSEHNIIGTAPKVAQQLCTAAAAGTVLVHDRTCRCSATTFEFAAVRHLRPIVGKIPVAARRLVTERTAPLQPLVATPMVGRAAELGAVLSLAADVIDGDRPRWLLVHGAAGIGKTRLVNEAIDSVVGSYPLTRVLRGRCTSSARPTGYWPLAEWVRHAAGIRLGERSGKSQERLRTALLDLLQPLRLPERDLEATVDALARSAGVPLPDGALERALPNEIADELGRAWPRFATACATVGPAILVVEDLHWADDALVQMLERVALRAQGPLLLLCTARTEFLAGHEGFATAGEHSSAVAIRPLTQMATAQLLDQLADRTPIAAARRSVVVATAEGNPFFLEQLLAHVAEGAAGLLPDSVQSVLAARIDALPDAEKRVLQHAAVVGRVFWQDAVSRTLDGTDVRAPLQALERRGLVQTRTMSSLSGEVELAFTHALVRDVAYGSLVPHRKSAVHSLIGTWLEERAEGSRDEIAELVAHQFATAAEATAEDPGGAAIEGPIRRKAFEYLMLAGVIARRRGAATGAIALHDRALVHATTDADHIGAFEALGDDYESLFHGDQATAAYLRALELARRPGSLSHERNRLCRKIALQMTMTPGAFRVNPDPVRAEEFVDEGLAAAADDVSRAWLLVARGACARLWQGSEPFGQGGQPDPVDIETRIAAVSQALETGARHSLPDLVAAANDALVVLFGIAGRYQDVVERARSQFESIEQVPSRLGQADVVRKVAVLAIEIEGRLVEGRDLAERACALSRDTNAHQLMHATYPFLVALYHLGHWPELLHIAEEHLAAFAEEPAVGCQFVRDGPVVAAVTLLHLGDAERARALASLVPDPRDEPALASAWQSRLAVLVGEPVLALEISVAKVAQGRMYGPQHAIAALEAFIALEDWAGLAQFLPSARAAVAGNALLKPWCERAAALAAAADGRRADARAGLTRAATWFAELGLEFESARAREYLAAFVPAIQHERLLTAAIARYERLGATGHANTARDRLDTGD